MSLLTRVSQKIILIVWILFESVSIFSFQKQHFPEGEGDVAVFTAIDWDRESS